MSSRSLLVGALLVVLAIPALGQPSAPLGQGPVQPPWSPCSQSHDEDRDGRPEGITYYVYDDAGALTDTVVFEDVQGAATAWQHLTIGPEGLPVRAVLRQPPSGPPGPARDCTRVWCSRAWVGQCPRGDCGRDAMGRVTTMDARGTVVRNDYSCWSVQDDRIRYSGPSLRELLRSPAAP